jgi:hypothetical protein
MPLTAVLRFLTSLLKAGDEGLSSSLALQCSCLSQFHHSRQIFYEDNPQHSPTCLHPKSRDTPQASLLSTGLILPVAVPLACARVSLLSRRPEGLPSPSVCTPQRCSNLSLHRVGSQATLVVLPEGYRREVLLVLRASQAALLSLLKSRESYWLPTIPRVNPWLDCCCRCDAPADPASPEYSNFVR